MIVWKNVLTLVQIAAGYGLLCAFLPSLCLKDFVEEKSLTYRFIFYGVCANMYLILWGFILAFVNCYNVFTLWLTLVLLPLAVTAWRKRETVVRQFLAGKETAETILTGMYGRHALARDLSIGIRRRVRMLYRRYLRGHGLELAGLCLIFAYILVAFGQYHLTHEEFAYGDENVHFYWTKELLHGNPFPVGMYPHGQHFLTGAITAMTGAQLSRASLLIGLFNDCLLFLTVYLVLKEIFPSRVAVLSGVGFFLTTDIFVWAVYWRYQAALPMEMGFIPYYTLFFGLKRYIGSKDRRDLLLSVLSLGWCIHIHFYTAIFAAVSCAAFGIAFFGPILRKKLLHMLIIGGLAGALLGVVPFAVGYALGFPFEQSMNWAMGVINQSTETRTANSLSEDTETEESEEANVVRAKRPLSEYWSTAFSPVEGSSARILLLLLGMAMLLWGFLGALFSRRNSLRYRMILFWGLVWFCCLVYRSEVVGIEIIQQYRFYAFYGLAAIPLFVVPAQLLWNVAAAIRVHPRRAETGLAVGALGFFFLLARNGHMKTEFTVETNIITEGDMKTCYRLMKEYPDETWTIISTTYDLNLIRYAGYHYEIVDLLAKLDAGKGSIDSPLTNDHIYLPTEDIFVVTETMIDQYYTSIVRRNSHADADILENHGEPTPELALTELPDPQVLDINSVKMYSYPWRAVVMSKLYYWMEKVKEVYPNEVSVFYQDETVTVYHISQDEYFPLDLMLDYQKALS